ncbi:MAG TPA: PilZ domain-containing protein [Candidatus Acidoferrales bacterium]|jgi:DNA-binding response OmpR family regulator|nr:PilZ domain-containing protein [Candidatus Acidoferrales bacterium]
MGKRALVVVDEGPAVSDLVEAVLKSAGMECITLTNSADAPVLLGNECFGMVVLDLHTLADAFALARLARESGFNRSTPILLMSDDQSTAAVSGGFEAGVSFFLYKPFDEGRLIKLVRAASDSAAPKKRRFRRVVLQSRVHLSSAQRKLEAETIDISLNGMLVRAEGHFPAGAAVNVSLYLGAAAPITCSGYVMRNLSGNRMAIHLDKLTPTESGRLQEFLLPLTMPERRSEIAAVVA